ncbi:MAG: hypothetical protein ACLGHN_03170 [Bacteriovoracia bacterium]
MAQVKGKEAREEREKMLVLKHKFENRITIAKFGKESLDAGDYSTALQKFVEYMQIMADVKKTKDIYGIKPGHFDPKKEITEMLMISHLYFEMARIYDAVPKFADDSKKCLEQFVLFSANQPYQVVNSEMIRKHLKKSVFKNADVFRSAYEQIYVQSKKCYVVTFCFGDDHPVTHECRDFKDWLLERSAGREIVRIYYKFSSDIVPSWESNRFMHGFAAIVFKPLLLLFSKTLLRLILK